MYSIYAATTDPAFNLALEEVLFDSLAPGHPGIFLIWRNRPSIIIGRHQNTAEEVNQQYCSKHDIRIVRRPTGGGAVYHDLGNINFSFLSWVEKNRIGGFDEYMHPMVQALRDLGIDAQYTSRNDITVQGRKVAGTAQRQTGQRMLHHGCLLINVDFTHLSGALAADPEKFKSKGVTSHKARVANIKEFLSDKLSLEECMNAVIQAMTARCSNEKRLLDQEFVTAAEKLADTKYRSWEWNWGNSPKYTEKRRRRFPWGRLELLLNVNQVIIQDCHIFGDFFARRDIEELQQALMKQKSDTASLRTALEQVPVESWFAGADRDELMNFLCGFQA